MKKQMTTAQRERLNKSISNEAKMYRAWLKAQKAVDKARKNF